MDTTPEIVRNDRQQTELPLSCEQITNKAIDPLKLSCTEGFRSSRIAFTQFVEFFCCAAKYNRRTQFFFQPTSPREPRLLGCKPPEAMPLETVQEAVRQRMIEEFKDKKFNELIEQLKDAAEIRDTDPPEENVNCGH